MLAEGLLSLLLIIACAAISLSATILVTTSLSSGLLKATNNYQREESCSHIPFSNHSSGTGKKGKRSSGLFKAHKQLST